MYLLSNTLPVGLQNLLRVGERQGSPPRTQPLGGNRSPFEGGRTTIVRICDVGLTNGRLPALRRSGQPLAAPYTLITLAFPANAQGRRSP